MNLKESLQSRQFKYGALSTAITVAALALLIVFNVVCSVLTDKFPLLIDLTPNSAFELSQESADFVRDVNKPIEITVLANEKQLEGSGDIYTAQIKNVIDQYAKHNKNITVSYVDLVTNPTFVTQYEDMNLNYNDVLIASGSRKRKVSMLDMFNVSTDQYGRQSITSSKAEQLMTAAIMGVTSESMPKVAFLTGHEETDPSAFKELLEQNNFEVSEINLTTGEIDPSIDILFWLSPSRDPDTEILTKLDTYLENGQQYGKTLLYAAHAQQPAMPNLEAFLEDWGILVEPGAVLETDDSKIFNYNPYFCTVDFTSMDYTDEIQTKIKVSMPFGRPLSAKFEAQSGFQTSVLLSYSETACVYPPDAPENWQPQKEDLHEIPAFIRSSFTRYEGTTPLTSNVFAASAVSAFNTSLLNSKSVTNADYFLQMMNTLTKREDVIKIAPKELGGSELGVNNMQISLISAVLVYIIPLLIVIAGFVVWMRRRHR